MSNNEVNAPPMSIATALEKIAKELELTREVLSSVTMKLKTPITLDELVTWGSHAAEKLFKSKGRVVPVYFTWSPKWPDGRFFAPAEVAVMKALFAQEEVERYVYVAEAWTAPAGTRPSEHPDRREVVMIAAEDGTGMKTGVRLILRPASGKPKLAPIFEVPEGEIGGRMANLLQRAETMRH